MREDGSYTLSQQLRCVRRTIVWHPGWRSGSLDCQIYWWRSQRRLLNLLDPLSIDPTSFHRRRRLTCLDWAVESWSRTSAAMQWCTATVYRDPVPCYLWALCIAECRQRSRGTRWQNYRWDDRWGRHKQAGIYESCYRSRWHIWVLLQVMLAYTGLATGQASVYGSCYWSNCHTPVLLQVMLTYMSLAAG